MNWEFAPVQANALKDLAEGFKFTYSSFVHHKHVNTKGLLLGNSIVFAHTFNFK